MPAADEWIKMAREDADRLDGLYAGMCEPGEYEHLIEAGLLRRTYDHPGGFLGLAKLERVKNDGP